MKKKTRKKIRKKRSKKIRKKTRKKMSNIFMIIGSNGRRSSLLEARVSWSFPFIHQRPHRSRPPKL